MKQAAGAVMPIEQAERSHRRRGHLGLAVGAALIGSVTSAAVAQKDRWADSASGLRTVAHDYTQERANYQLIPHKQGNRWLLYVGHIRGSGLNPMTGKVEGNGTSVLDVTDPTHPRYLTHIPLFPSPWSDGTAEEQTGGQHVQLCDGSTLPGGRRGAVYMLRSKGSVGQEMVDVTDPEKPRFLNDVVRVGRPTDGFLRTHKNVWDCASGTAYTVGSIKGWPAMQLQIFDLSNPEKPRHVRDFGIAGTQPGTKAPITDDFQIHEAQIFGDRVYLTYGPDRLGLIEILDKKKLLEGDPADPDRMAPTDRSLTYPIIGTIRLPSYWGAHTAMPFMQMRVPDLSRDPKGAKRDVLFVTSEGINPMCTKVRHATWFVDITEPQHPWPISTYQVAADAAPKGTPSFCNRPGTNFGPHTVPTTRLPGYDGRILFLSYFNAGLRVIDMRDPFAPKEIGHWLAARTPKTRFVRPPNLLPAYQTPLPPPGAKPFSITNTVELDPRGRYVYVADRSGNGIYVLEPTGAVKALAELK